MLFAFQSTFLADVCQDDNAIRLLQSCKSNANQGGGTNGHKRESARGKLGAKKKGEGAESLEVLKIIP